MGQVNRRPGALRRPDFHFTKRLAKPVPLSLSAHPEISRISAVWKTLVRTSRARAISSIKGLIVKRTNVGKTALILFALAALVLSASAAAKPKSPPVKTGVSYDEADFRGLAACDLNWTEATGPNKVTDTCDGLVAAALAATGGRPSLAAGRAAPQGTYSGPLTYSTYASAGDVAAAVTLTGSWALMVGADGSASGSFGVSGLLAGGDSSTCSFSAPLTYNGTFSGTVAGGTATLTVPYTVAATTVTVSCVGVGAGSGTSSAPVPGTGGSLEIGLPLDVLVKTGSYTTQGLTFGLSQSPPATTEPKKPSCSQQPRQGRDLCPSGRVESFKLPSGELFLNKKAIAKFGPSMLPELEQGTIFWVPNPTDRVGCTAPNAQDLTAGRPPCVVVYAPGRDIVVSGTAEVVHDANGLTAVYCVHGTCEVSWDEKSQASKPLRATLHRAQKVVIPAKGQPKPVQKFNPARAVAWCRCAAARH